jgi:hypothetical protein
MFNRLQKPKFNNEYKTNLNMLPGTGIVFRGVDGGEVNAMIVLTKPAIILDIYGEPDDVDGKLEYFFQGVTMVPRLERDFDPSADDNIILISGNRFVGGVRGERGLGASAFIKQIKCLGRSNPRPEINKKMAFSKIDNLVHDHFGPIRLQRYQPLFSFT